MIKCMPPEDSSVDEAESVLWLVVEETTTDCGGGKHQTLTDTSLTTVTLKPSEAPHFVAFGTVPVILKNGNHRLEVNALSYDASTRTYLNADIAAK